MIKCAVTPLKNALSPNFVAHARRIECDVVVTFLRDDIEKATLCPNELLSSTCDGRPRSVIIKGPRSTAFFARQRPDPLDRELALVCLRPGGHWTWLELYCWPQSKMAVPTMEKFIRDAMAEALGSYSFLPIVVANQPWSFEKYEKEST